MKQALIAGASLLFWGHSAAAQSEPVPSQAPQDTAVPPQSAASPDSVAGAQGVLTFLPDFFASSSPNSAFDMIQRLPGFGLDIGNTQARGLAGAAGNVLINGDRPSSKSDSLDQILRRVPAASVERVELIRGGAPGIDMQGRSVVANVVLKQAATTEIAAEGNIYAYPDLYFGPQLRLQYSRQEGDNQTEAAIFATTDRTGNTAQGERIRFDEDGAVIQEADLDLWDRFMDINGRGTLQRRLAGGKLRLNGLVGYNGHKNRQLVEVTSGAGSDTRNEDQSRTWSGEFGATWSRPLGTRSDIELTALQRSNFFDYDSDSLNNAGTSTFGIASTSGESIGRAIWKFRPSKTWAFEAGGEGAYNFLDSDTDFTENGLAVDLPNSAVLVEELRGEAWAQATWQPSETLTLQAAMRAEVSRISQEGDSNLSKSFFYPKPRAQLTWQLAPQHQLRLRFQKEVGQLDFGDFVASTEVNLGTVAGGNAELVPQKETVFEAVYEYRFWNKGALELTAQHRLVDDIIDVIPLEGGFEAVGNIGSGRRDFVQARLSLPMDRLGLKDALLQARGSWSWSRATDPLTGEHRRFSGELPFGCGVNFNQDLKGGRFSYGFDHGCNVDENVNYRVRERRFFEGEPYITIYGQWKPSSDLTIRLDFANITNAEQRNEREIHSGRRDLTPLLFRELRSIRQGEWLFLQIRKVL